MADNTVTKLRENDKQKLMIYKTTQKTKDCATRPDEKPRVNTSASEDKQFLLHYIIIDRLIDYSLA